MARRNRIRPRGSVAPDVDAAEYRWSAPPAYVAEGVHVDAAAGHPLQILHRSWQASATPSVATSIRLPAGVDRAAKMAVDAGWASSVTELVVEGLRARLTAQAVEELDDEALDALQDALEQHYAEHPEARPSLADIAHSAAELDGHPAAARRDLIEMAADDLGEDAFVEDVLAWVRGALLATVPAPS